MNSIQNLCKECLLLKYGTVHSFGKTTPIIKNYLNEEKKNHSFVSGKKNSSKKLHFNSIKIANSESYNIDGLLFFEISVYSQDKISASLDVRLSDAFLQPCAFASLGALDYSECIVFIKGMNRLCVNLDISKLAIGDYYLSFDLTIPNIEYLDREENCIQFEILKNSGDINSRFLDQNWNFGSTYLKLAKSNNAF